MDSSMLTFVVPLALIAVFVIVKQLGQISAAQAKSLVAAGATLVDVRSPGEFAGGHLPNAVNLPLQDLGGKHKALGDKSKPVVLYCASGTRSAMAKNTLKTLGFSQVYNLGAMSRW